jgi:hypothetical protein
MKERKQYGYKDCVWVLGWYVLQQVGECWVCVIFFAWLEIVSRFHKGVRVPLRRAWGEVPPRNLFLVIFCICFWVVFQHIVFINGFTITS